MPFFQGAYNFEINGGTFYDAAGNRHTHRYHTLHPELNPWAPSTSQGSQKPTGTSTHPPTSPPISGPTYSQTTSDEESQTSEVTSGYCKHRVWTLLTDTLPRQIYLYFLLRLPALYCSRVDRLSRDAHLVLRELLDTAVQASSEGEKDFQGRMSDFGLDPAPDLSSSSLPPAYQKLANRWGIFIENLVKEWKTMNIVSALLVSAILTMFQVDGASNDPVTRYLAFWSLISALLSLLYGCSLIVQFSRMRRPSIVIEWAFEAQIPQSIIWSVWVMLALPVVWLAWSIVAFIVCIMAFMWRSGAVPPEVFIVPPSTELGFRIFVSAVLGVGVIYGLLMCVTFQRYGEKMDEALKRRIDRYIASASGPSPHQPSTSHTSSASTRPPSPKPRSKRRPKNAKSRSVPMSLAPSTTSTLQPPASTAPPQHFKSPSPNPPYPISSSPNSNLHPDVSLSQMVQRAVAVETSGFDPGKSWQATSRGVPSVQAGSRQSSIQSPTSTFGAPGMTQTASIGPLSSVVPFAVANTAQRCEET